MTRVTLPVGEALRLEMSDTATADVVHVQYYIATESGGWALWASSAVGDLGAVEAALPDLTIPEET